MWIPIKRHDQLNKSSFWSFLTRSQTLGKNICNHIELFCVLL